MTHTTDSTAHLVVEIPDAPTIPGLRFRRWAGPADIPAMWAVAEAARHANGDDELSTIEQMEHDYAHLTNSDPARDVLLVLVGEELVAYGRVHFEDRADGSRAFVSFGFVHPDWRRRGIGTAMRSWFEARCLEIGAGQPADRPRLLAGWSDEHDPGSTPLLRNAGFTPERRFVHMVRPHLRAIAVTPLPEGLEIRPATLEHARAMFEGDVESFRDHWGSTDGSEIAFQRFLGRPGLDPSLWVMAWDGDECAGAVELEIDPKADAASGPVLGWLARVWVRRPWRKRGLARALMGRSLIVLRERGADGAQLYVDVDNAQGALDLYTGAGFTIESEAVAWRKPWPVPVPLPDGTQGSLGWRRR